MSNRSHLTKFLASPPHLATLLLAATSFSALLLVTYPASLHAQRQSLSPTPESPAESLPRRLHLVMKDGSYQVVLSYTITGNVVRYRSAERSGEVEDVPLSLVDLPATEAWVRDHAPSAQASQRQPVLSPELAREEAQRAARTPEVLPDLRLPEEDSVLALDTYNGGPELVPLEQEGGDLNKATAHDVQKVEINPASVQHRLLAVRGERADIQLHTPRPAFFVRLGATDAGEAGSNAFVVDTDAAHDAHPGPGRATPSGGAESSSYVLERLPVVDESRVVSSFRIAWLGQKPQPDLVELIADPLPGGQWLKLTPTQPLEPGEYALIEVISSHELNLGVWDFGMHPDAREDVEAIRPQVRHSVTLERRSPQ